MQSLAWTCLRTKVMSHHGPGIGELLMDVLAVLARGTSQCADGEHDSSSLLLLGPPGVGAHHPCMGIMWYQLALVQAGSPRKAVISCANLIYCVRPKAAQAACD